MVRTLGHNIYPLCLDEIIIIHRYDGTIAYTCSMCVTMATRVCLTYYGKGAKLEGVYE